MSLDNNNIKVFDKLKAPLDPLYEKIASGRSCSVLKDKDWIGKLKQPACFVYCGLTQSELRRKSYKYPIIRQVSKMTSSRMIGLIRSMTFIHNS